MSENPLEPLPQIHIPGVSAVPSPSAQITVHHVFILDASGSMASLRQNTINGFNEQVQEIRRLETDFPDQRNLVTLIFFNGQVTTRFFDTSSESLQEITEEDYRPNGSTRLYATVGETLERLKGHLGDRLASDRVVVTIITDGENTDQDARWTQIALREYIQQVQADHHWVVTFIGANIDVEATSRSLGIPMSNTLAYTASASGTQAVFRETGAARRRYASVLREAPESRSADLYFTQDTARGLDLREGSPPTPKAFQVVDLSKINWDEMAAQLRGSKSKDPATN